MSLLDKALELERQPKVDAVNAEQIEMGIAWAEGEVSTGACARALGMSQPSGAIPLLARYLQAAVRDGYLKRTSKAIKPNGAPVKETIA